MGKPKKDSKSWVGKVIEDEQLSELDILTLLNTAANGKIKEKKAVELNKKLLQCFKDNKHNALEKVFETYSPEQKLRILTLDNDYLFNMAAGYGDLKTLEFFQEQLGENKLIEMVRKKNLQTIYSFLAGEWSRAKHLDRMSSKNCIECFKFFLTLIPEGEIKTIIKNPDSDVVYLKSVEDDFNTAVAQLKEEGPHAKRVRESSSRSSSPTL